MKPGNAIEVKDLKITYKCVKSLSMRKSLFHLRKSKLEVYEALRGISFEVKKGEIMGIVGKNGSGKSTLLRAIAGIFSADSGFCIPPFHRCWISEKIKRTGKHYFIGNAAGFLGAGSTG